MSLRSTRTRTRGTALRTTLWIFTLVGIGGAVSAGALAVANTVATLPSPREANLRRLVDQPPLMAEDESVDLASLTTTDDDAPADAATAAAPLAAIRDPGPASEPSPGGSPAGQAGRAANPDRPAPVARPKSAVAKPTAKVPTNTVLNDAQIAALKQRLRLSPGQEPYWPEIESSLRAVARQINDANRRGRGAPVPVDTSTPEIERLKSAAMPFLMQMRPDQKSEIIALARIMGMESMVALL